MPQKDSVLDIAQVRRYTRVKRKKLPNRSFFQNVSTVFIFLFFERISLVYDELL